MVHRGFMLKPLLALALLSTTACSSSHAAPSIATPAPVAATASTTASATATAAAKPDVASTAMYELAARRAQMIGWLREYREAGQYPTDASGRVASVFVGVNGVRCPMAELLHKSGRDDLVAAVARDNNIVRLADVRQGPLYDWMLASGLTLAEIDMVQGIAMIDYGWMEDQVIETAPMILAGQAQVRGKIETVETALRNSTATSLAIVTKRLPAQRTVESLASAKITNGVAIVPAPSRAELEARAKAERDALALQVQPRRVRLRPVALDQIQFRN